LISSNGIIPISDKRDVAGPIARTVKDAAHILSILAKSDSSDDHSSQESNGPTPDFAASCTKTDLKGTRIGVPRNIPGASSEYVVSQFERTLKTLKQAGAEIIEDTNLAGIELWKDLSARTRTMAVISDMKDSMSRYFQSLVTNPLNIKSLVDLIRLTKDTKEEDYPERNVAFFEEAQSVRQDEPAFVDFQNIEEYIAGEGGIPGAIDKWSLDAVVCPSSDGLISTFAAIARAPAISLPMGSYPQGTPVEMDSISDLVTVAPGIP
jgi:amidase